MAVPLIPLALEAVEGGIAAAAGSGLMRQFAGSALRSTASHLLMGGDDDQPDDTVDDNPRTVHFD